MKPYYQDDSVTIYHGDCREILPTLEPVDLVLTDPPYPDQHLEYGLVDISFLAQFSCRQLIFWSNKAGFPLDFTAIHIWDKLQGVASEYERIFERNGHHNYKMFRAFRGQNRVGAQRSRDILTGHPSQKPRYLIDKLVVWASRPDQLILDPFLGSGTTAFCAKMMGRKAIGIEIEEKYCEIAAKRMSQSVMELSA